MKLWHIAIATCASLASSASASGNVIVVKAAGGGSFTEIQPAVNAASDGDTILVKPGSYDAFTINGKALTVIGDVGAQVSSLINVDATVLIENLTEGQVVSLVRLKVKGVGTGLAAPGAKALRVLNCSGAVRAVQCEFLGRNGLTSTIPGVGVHIVSSNDVAISGSTVKGGAGVSDYTCMAPSFPTAGVSGLWVEGGAAAAYECIIDGGHGGNGGDYTREGGPGMYVRTPSGSSEPSFLFAGRSNVHGGHGGNSSCEYGCPSDGGGGLHLVDSTDSTPDAIGWALDVMIGGGAAGEIQLPRMWVSCAPTFDGPAYLELLPFQFSAASLGFSIPWIAREGEFVTATFTGPPGARVYVNDRLTTTFEAAASWRGVLLAPFAPYGAPTREIKWGVIPASGVLTRTYAVPQLPAGVQAQTRFLQAYRVGANGITLGSFRTLTILDSAF